MDKRFERILHQRRINRWQIITWNKVQNHQSLEKCWLEPAGYNSRWGYRATEALILSWWGFKVLVPFVLVVPKTFWLFFININTYVPYDPTTSHPGEIKTCSHTNLHTYVHSSFIHNHQQTGKQTIVHQLINWWVDKLAVVLPTYRIHTV